MGMESIDITGVPQRMNNNSAYSSNLMSQQSLQKNHPFLMKMGGQAMTPAILANVKGPIMESSNDKYTPLITF